MPVLQQVGHRRVWPSDALREAVHRFKAASRDGIRERIFTLAFRGPVYPQIWEDPEVDLKALRFRPARAWSLSRRAAATSSPI